MELICFFFFSSRRRHTRSKRDWSSDVCSSDLPSGIEIVDQHEDFAILAVQGPRSPEVLDRLGIAAAMDYMAFDRAGSLTVCRTGYTGEHGYELVVPAAEAGALWDRLCAAVAEEGGRPCGLG